MTICITICDMSDQTRPVDPIDALASLAEPTRRRLYDLVASAGGGFVGRDEAARTLGIGRPLAAFHMDRLVEAGLVVAEFRRLSGRSGPGAGRPAKVYRRAASTVEVSLPERRYATAATIFATALAAEVAQRPVVDRSADPTLDGAPAASADGAPDAPAGTPDAPAEPLSTRIRLLDAARAEGRRLGERAAPAGLARRDGRGVMLAALRDGGFEPREAADGEIRLLNCPFEAVAKALPDVTCAMNRELLAGMTDAIPDAGLTVVAVPADGTCCVALRPAGSG